MPLGFIAMIVHIEKSDKCYNELVKVSKPSI